MNTSGELAIKRMVVQAVTVHGDPQRGIIENGGAWSASRTGRSTSSARQRGRIARKARTAWAEPYRDKAAFLHDLRISGQDPPRFCSGYKQIHILMPNASGMYAISRCAFSRRQS